MKKISIYAAWLLVVAALLLTAQARTWTVGSNTYEGEYVRTTPNGKVVIKTEDDIEVALPKAKLSAADQKYLDAQPEGGRAVEVVAGAGIPRKNWYAIIVGVNIYADAGIPDLSYCVADANALAEKFKALGFPEENIILLVDSVNVRLQPTRKNILKYLKDMQDREVPENSLIIFSFSGHGVEVPGKGACFLPTDCDVSQLEDTVVAADEVYNLLENTSMQVKIMVVDACRKITSRGLPEGAKGFQIKDPPQGLAFLQSCSSNEYSHESETIQHGYFTYTLLEALEGKADANNDGEVTLREIFQYTSSETQKRVLNDKSATQRPFYSFNGATVPDYTMVAGLLVDGLTKAQRDEAEQLYKAADEAFNNNDYDTAQEKINNALAIHEKNPKYLEKKRIIDKFVEEAKARREAEEAAKEADKARKKAEAEKLAADKKAKEEADARQKAEKERLAAEANNPKPTPVTPSKPPVVTPPKPTQTASNIPPSNPQAGDRWVKTINGVEFAFRWCPAGEFMMGSPTSEEGRLDEVETQHRVTIRKGFWMMETEVTQKQWEAVMGTTVREQCAKAYDDAELYGEGGNYPMYYISWYDCQEFCRKLTALGLPVGLPSEAQWEYACRAGTMGPYAGNLDDMAWYDSNSGDTTHPVGTKKANAWGLCDMHGNVWEWCQDAWQSDISSNNIEESADGNGANRVNCGGSWDDDARYCRSAYRDYHSPEYRFNRLGFRCCFVPENQ